MHRRVVVTDDARRDLEGIYNHLAESASVAVAERMATRVLDLAASLTEFPERGSHPRALAELGHLEFRQVMLKPWLVTYGISKHDVVIYLIADGRRDMRALLMERLLQS